MREKRDISFHFERNKRREKRRKRKREKREEEELELEERVSSRGKGENPHYYGIVRLGQWVD